MLIFKIRCKDNTFFSHMQFFSKKNRKNLHICKFFSTFAPVFVRVVHSRAFTGKND